ncbi:hypothetical protein SDC9_191537 [bioreactor metagenome]|uniref:Uncharacterized protein n=1 Tax=bioreactor metagenome TaxID=1076179 RepID=A0A645HZF5_9ZZZZ
MIALCHGDRHARICRSRNGPESSRLRRRVAVIRIIAAEKHIIQRRRFALYTVDPCGEIIGLVVQVRRNGNVFRNDRRKRNCRQYAEYQGRCQEDG